MGPTAATTEFPGRLRADLDETLLEAFQRETSLFVESTLREDRREVRPQPACIEGCGAQRTTSFACRRTRAVEVRDGVAVDDMQALNYRIATHRPGDAPTLLFLERIHSMTIEVVGVRARRHTLVRRSALISSVPGLAVQRVELGPQGSYLVGTSEIAPERFKRELRASVLAGRLVTPAQQ